MPTLISHRAKYRMARRGFRNAKELACAVALPHGRVRNGIGGTGWLKLVDIFTLAKALREDNETIEAVVADLVGSNDGVPEEPPEQPKKAVGPKRRQGTEDKRTGPKRERVA